MKIQLNIGDDQFTIDSETGKSIAIDLDFNNAQPNHFGVQQATSQPVEVGEFVGSTEKGGSCNVEQISLIPHCNGTHTETVGHIVNERVSIASVLKDTFSLCTLISVTPISAKDSEEEYSPTLDDGDLVITSQAIAEALSGLFRAPALVIRTLPNDDAKTSCNYGNDRPAPFLTCDAIELVNEIGVQHLLVDVPSIDRSNDDGLLTNHHLFWNVPEGTNSLIDESMKSKTITELVYVPDAFSDGVYFLNLQVPAFVCDAAPSRPVLFEMI